MMKQASQRSTLLRAAGTLLTLGLLAYLLYQQGWQEILAALTQIPVEYFLLTILLIAISRLAVTARWHVLLRSAGVNIGFVQSLKLTFAGLFASNFLPTTIGGDVIRLLGAIQLHFDGAICTASLIVDRLVGMAGMLFAVPLCLPALLLPRIATGLVPNDIAGFVPRIHVGQEHQRITACDPASLCEAGAFLGLGAQKAWERSRQWLRDFLKALWGALVIWIRHPRSLVISLGWSGVHMLCIFIILYLFFQGMGEAISIWLVAGLYSLVYLVTLIPVSINGYGLQEISLTFMFTQFGRVSLESALAAALLFRTLVMAASLPGAAFAPGMLAAREKDIST